MKNTKEVENKDLSNRSKLQIYIEDRLTDYGFSTKTNSTKYQVYTSVRKIVSLHLEMDGRMMLTDEDLSEAIKIVDIILPKKSKDIDPIVERSMRDSKLSFKEIVGNSIHKLVDYLEDKSRIDINGMAGPECYVNKEALRIAAGCIRDYIDIIDSYGAYISGKTVIKIIKSQGKYPALESLITSILENNEHIPCWKNLTSKQLLEWNDLSEDVEIR